MNYAWVGTPEHNNLQQRQREAFYVYVAVFVSMSAHETKPCKHWQQLQYIYIIHIPIDTGH